jgi:hypothetical protein
MVGSATTRIVMAGIQNGAQPTHHGVPTQIHFCQASGRGYLGDSLGNINAILLISICLRLS